jgi:hypothetical protein
MCIQCTRIAGSGPAAAVSAKSYAPDASRCDDGRPEPPVGTPVGRNGPSPPSRLALTSEIAERHDRGRPAAGQEQWRSTDPIAAEEATTLTTAAGTAPAARKAGRSGLLFAAGAFAMFVVVWVGSAVALTGDAAFVDSAWQWLRGLPAPVEVVVWVVFLPIAVGMWIWESTWQPFVGFLLACGMVGWTLVAVSGLRRALRGR